MSTIIENKKITGNENKPKKETTTASQNKTFEKCTNTDTNAKINKVLIFEINKFENIYYFFCFFFF